MSSSIVTAFLTHREGDGGVRSAQRTGDPVLTCDDAEGPRGYYSWKMRRNAVGRGRDGVIRHFSVFGTGDEDVSPNHGDASGANKTKTRSAPADGRRKGQGRFESPDRGVRRAKTTTGPEIPTPGEGACGVSFDTVIGNVGGSTDNELMFSGLD